MGFSKKDKQEIAKAIQSGKTNITTSSYNPTEQGSQQSGAAPSTPQSGSAPKQGFSASDKKYIAEALAKGQTSINLPGYKPYEAPAAPAPSNPLSDTVMSLTNQRDKIANATPAEFASPAVAARNKYPDTLSRYMQQRGLAEYDKLIEDQKLKEQADSLKKGMGTNPITDTLLNPLGQNSAIPQAAFTPIANYNPLIDGPAGIISRMEESSKGKVNKAKRDYEQAKQEYGNALSTIDEAEKKIPQIDNEIEDIISRIGMETDPATLQSLDRQLADLKQQKADYENAIPNAEDIIYRLTTPQEEIDKSEAAFAAHQEKTQQEQTQLNDIWKRIDEIDNVAAYVTDASEGLRLSEEKSALLNQAHQMLLDNPDLENPSGAAAWQAGRGSAWQGANSVARSFSNTLEALGIGDFAQEVWYGLGFSGDNPLKALNKLVNKEGEEFQEYYATETRGDKAAESINKYGPQVVAALPAVAMAYATAGTSVATTAGLETTAFLNSLSGAEQTTAIIGNAIKTMSTNPDFMLSFTQEAGNAYQSAKEDGMSDTDAAMYSMLYGYVSAMVEVGGTSEIAGGLQQQAKEVVKGGKGVIPGIWDYAKSIIGEMGEENTQGMLERGLKSFFGQDTAVFSADTPRIPGLDALYAKEPGQNAIVNPSEMKEEAKGAAVVSAILGAPGAATNTVNAVRESKSESAPTAEATPAVETTPTAGPVSETATEANPATEALLNSLNRRNDEGNVTNAATKAILADQTLVDLFNENVPAESQITAENNAKNRQAIRDNADAVTAALIGETTTEAPVPATAPTIEAKSSVVPQQTETAQPEGINTLAETETTETPVTQQNINEETTPEVTPATEPSLEDKIQAVMSDSEYWGDPMTYEEARRFVLETEAEQNGTTLRERGESRNIRTDENRATELREFKEQNPDYYEVVKNDKTLQKAIDIFDSQGVEGAAQTLERALYDAQNGKKLALEMVPLHKLVCDELAKSGQVERANRISADLGAELTYAGQMNQANAILRNVSPTAKAEAFAKTLSKIIGENNANIDQTAIDDLVNRYRAAETDEARNAIVDEATTAIAESSPTTIREALTAIRYLNMLGNFKTQIRNLAGNTGMLLVARAKNRVLAVEQAAWNAAFNKNQVERTNTLTTNPELFKEAWNMFAEDQKEAFGEGKYSDVAAKNNDVADKKTIFKWNWKTEADTAADKVARKIADAPMKVLEAYRKATKWAMEDGDVIFQKVTYAQVLADYAKAQGYKSLSDIDPDTLQKMRKRAVTEAQEATFHDKNSVSEWFSSFDRGWENKGVAGKVAKTVAQGVIPFRQTPANVGVRMEEYSPLGVVNTFVDAFQAAKKNGSTDVNTVLNSAAKTLSGTGLAFLGYVLAKNGLARGKNDDKELEAYERNVQGMSDYSIVMPDGSSVSMDWFAPESAAFFVGVAAADAFKDGTQADDFLTLLGSTTDIAFNMSFLSGLNDSLENLKKSYGDKSAFVSYVLNSLISYGGQIATNSLLGQAEQASERYRQTSYTDKDSAIPSDVQYALSKLSGKTPGVDYNQADYIDAWGRKQDNGENVVGRAAESFFSPAYINESRSTEVDDELKRLHEATKDTVKGSVLPAVAPRSNAVDDIPLTSEEYEIYQTKNGQTALKLVSDFINGDGYDALTDEQKAKGIQKLYDFAADAAEKSIRLERGEQPEKTAYDKARSIKDAGGMSWAEYYQTQDSRDMDGNGSYAQEETAQYLFENFPEDKAKKIYDAYYPNSKTPYEDYAKTSQIAQDSGYTKEAYDALVDTVTHAKDGKETWDSTGDSLVIDTIMKAVDDGLTEDGAIKLLSEKTSNNYKHPFAALIDEGYAMQEAMDLIDQIDKPSKDNPGNKAIEQSELKVFYKEHPELEKVISVIWDAMGYKGKDTKDFETYKKSLK